ncbi:hypothetical protein APR09_003674 [Nocardia amikacinitolerans]|nr:hypothetical protein [Nocardia amikacinitolerans]
MIAATTATPTSTTAPITTHFVGDEFSLALSVECTIGLPLEPASSPKTPPVYPVV